MSVKLSEKIKTQKAYVSSHQITLNHANINSIGTNAQFQFVNVLHLTNNKLQTLQGIEQFIYLKSFSISRNLIVNVNELYRIQNPLLLQQLCCSHNPFTWNPIHVTLILQKFTNLTILDKFRIDSNLQQNYFNWSDQISKLILPAYQNLIALVNTQINMAPILKIKNEILKEVKKYEPDFFSINQLFQQMLSKINEFETFHPVVKFIQETRNQIQKAQDYEEVKIDAKEFQLKKEKIANLQKSLLLEVLYISKNKYKNNDLQQFLMQQALENHDTDLFLFAQNQDYAEQMISCNFNQLLPSYQMRYLTAEQSLLEDLLEKSYPEKKISFKGTLSEFTMLFPYFPLNESYLFSIFTVFSNYLNKIQHIEDVDYRRYDKPLQKKCLKEVIRSNDYINAQKSLGIKENRQEKAFYNTKPVSQRNHKSVDQKQQVHNVFQLNQTLKKFFLRNKKVLFQKLKSIKSKFDQNAYKCQILFKNVKRLSQSLSYDNRKNGFRRLKAILFQAKLAKFSENFEKINLYQSFIKFEYQSQILQAKLQGQHDLRLKQKVFKGFQQLQEHQQDAIKNLLNIYEKGQKSLMKNYLRQWKLVNYYDKFTDQQKKQSRNSLQTVRTSANWTANPFNTNSTQLQVPAKYSNSKSVHLQDNENQQKQKFNQESQLRTSQNDSQSQERKTIKYKDRKIKTQWESGVQIECNKVIIQQETNKRKKKLKKTKSERQQTSTKKCKYCKCQQQGKCEICREYLDQKRRIKKISPNLFF